MRKLLRLVPLALVLGVAAAQTPSASPPAATATAGAGRLVGVVTDASADKPVPGALVIATGPGGEQSAVTDEKGAFAIDGLAPGRYTLAVQLEGFGPAERGDLEVEADRTLRANLAVVPSSVRMDEVVVTGSRIRRKDLTTPAPVTVIGAEQLAVSGRASVGELLQTLPEQGSARNTQVNNGGAGATRVNLRGLSSLRTLVLVNGRRVVFTGVGTNTGTGVDLNMIPTNAIERVEVLKDGASAQYGSDAIAGVVNIITKKPHDGTDASLFSGIATHGDGLTYDLNLTTGTSGERGGVLFSAGYLEQQATWARNRDFSRTQKFIDTTTGEVFSIGSSRIPAGRITLAPSQRGVANGNAAWNALVGANPSAGSFMYDPAHATAATAFFRPYVGGATGVDLPPNGDAYNFQDQNYNLTPSNRINLYSTGDFKLASSVRAFFETTYVNRSSRQNGAPTPLVLGAGGLEGVVVSAQNVYNPFGRDFVDQYTKRLVEFGNREFREDLDTFRVVGGLNGTFPAASGWFWDASLNYGRTTGIYQNRGELDKTRIQSAVGPSFVDPATGRATCGTAAAPIAGCVPLDLFHGPSITREQAAYVSFVGVSRVSNELMSAQVNTTGELFRLLSERPVGVAVGYEYRVEQGADQPDPVTAAFESSGNNRAPTQGRFHANEGYVELALPIVGNIPFVSDLEATAAARVFGYSNFGTDWTYKLGGRWRVIPDFTLRGTYSTAFRAPSIQELFLGASDNFPNLSDPCADLTGAPAALVANCRARGVPAGGSGDVNTQFRSRNGGAPNLQPETAKTWTVGTVIEPRMVKNLSVTLDFYYIALRRAISSFGAPFIVNNCYSSTGPGDPALCALVQRDASGLITNITDVNVNVGGLDTSGADLAIRYRYDTAALGTFGFGFDGTWLAKLDQIQPDGRVIHGAGTFDFAFTNGNIGFGGVFPRFKFNAGATWNRKGFGAGVNTRFVGRFKECGDPADGTISGGTLCADDPTVSRHVSPYNVWDAFVSYDFASRAGKTGVAVGVRNVFDAAPPIIYSSITPQSDPTAYDFVGRFVYLNLSHRL